MGFNFLPWREQRDRMARCRFYCILCLFALGVTIVQTLFWWQHQQGFTALERAAQDTRETLGELERRLADIQAHTDQHAADAAWVEAQIKLLVTGQAMMQSPADLIAHIVSVRPRLFWIKRLAFNRPAASEHYGMVVIEAQTVLGERIPKLVRPFNRDKGEQVRLGELEINALGLYDVRLEIVQ